MRALILLAGLLATPALAQVSYPPGASPGTLAALTAQLPPTCTTPPAADAVNGTAGTGPACVHRQDAAAATMVMPANAVTLADGTFTGSWPATFAAAPTTAMAAARTTTDPFTCQVGVATATSFSGKCWKGTTALTLPAAATALLGLVLAINPPAPAGITVMIVGRQ